MWPINTKILPGKGQTVQKLVSWVLNWRNNGLNPQGNLTGKWITGRTRDNKKQVGPMTSRTKRPGSNKKGCKHRHKEQWHKTLKIIITKIKIKVHEHSDWTSYFFHFTSFYFCFDHILLNYSFYNVYYALWNIWWKALWITSIKLVQCKESCLILQWQSFAKWHMTNLCL